MTGPGFFKTASEEAQQRSVGSAFDVLATDKTALEKAAALGNKSPEQQQNYQEALKFLQGLCDTKQVLQEVNASRHGPTVS